MSPKKRLGSGYICYYYLFEDFEYKKMHERFQILRIDDLDPSFFFQNISAKLINVTYY